MERLYLFLIRNDVWIYILSILGLIWYASELVRAQRLLQRAVYNLERESGTRIRNNALAFVCLFGSLIAIVYYVNTRVAPSLPAELMLPPTPTPNVFATPLVSPTPLAPFFPDDSRPTPPALAPTVTLPGILAPEESEVEDQTPGAEEEPTPEFIPTPFVGCTTQLNIAEPRDGAAVSGTITFQGTANTGDGHVYMLETNGPQTAGSWAPLINEAVAQPVLQSLLGNVDLSQWSSGPYLIRLLARDRFGNDLGQCVIQVTLDSG